MELLSCYEIRRYQQVDSVYRYVKTIILLAGIAQVLFTSSINSEEYGYKRELDVPLHQYAYLVDELDYRRRLQFLYPNPQSIFHGLNIGYVQTSTGSLSFQRRDLVVLGDPTIVASRIYDSKYFMNEGFGPGWRLNLLETVDRVGDTATHVDGSGARHQFKKHDRAVFVPNRIAPETSGTTLSIIGDLAVIRDRRGGIRQFRKFDATDTYRLTRSVKPNRKSITYEYESQKLLSVSIGGETALRFSWIGDQIERIKDKYDREVSFEYDNLGRLVRTIDVANQFWSYEYNEDQRLVRATYPNGETYLDVEYDPYDRVSKMQDARDYSFRYFDRTTIVTEPDGIQHTFTKDELGITVGYRSNRGMSWQIGIDEFRRIVELERNNDLYKFGYTDGLWTSLNHPGGTRAFHYDDQGRYVRSSGEEIRNGYVTREVRYNKNVTTVVFDDSVELTYRIENDGRISEITKEKDVIRISRDKDGFVDSILENEESLVFSRNSRGRIESTQYPTGRRSSYEYDRLGNRNVVSYSSGARMKIRFDGRGNIVGVEDISADGETTSQFYEIDHRNRVTKVDFASDLNLIVLYDYAGRPSKFNIGDQEIHVGYYANGEFASLKSGQTTWKPEANVASNVYFYATPNPRELINNDASGNLKSQPNYGVINIEVGSFDASIIRVEDISIVGFERAESTLSLVQAWMNGDIASNFEKPSNSIFQPPEYESTNCCLACPLGAAACGYQCTTYFLAPGEYTCQCQLFACIPGTNCPEPTCSTTAKSNVDAARAILKTSLKALPFVNYEHGMTASCPNPNSVSWSDSASSYTNCVAIPIDDDVIYMGHTHPRYGPNDRNKTICCNADNLDKPIGSCFTMPDMTTVNYVNARNRSCSPADHEADEIKPLLLRSSLSRRVREC